MHVAIITTEYPSYNNTGGIATFTAGLAQLLANIGHQVTVFTDSGHSSIDMTAIDGITITPFLNSSSSKLIRCATSFLPCQLIISILQKYYPSTFRLLRFNLLALFSFLFYKNHSDIRIIHTPVLFAPGYLISLVFPDLVTITHAQGPDELLQPYNAVTRDSRLKAWIETQYMMRSNLIVSCSRSVTKYLRMKHKNIKKKLIFITNFIDTKLFRSPKMSLATNTLLFIGRLEYRKGPDLVMTAFSTLSQQYPKMKLIFIGDDTKAWSVDGKRCFFSDYLKSLRMPAHVRRRIVFVPRINNRSALIDYITTHRGIAILPSRYEPFGFVYIETMMGGCITIASKMGGGSEIIQNNVDGFTINPTFRDIVKYVHKIKNLQGKQLSKIVRRAKEKVHNKYDISCVVAAYRNLYSKMKIFISSSRLEQY